MMIVCDCNGGSIAKAAILECFAEAGMKLLTAKQLECIDHIAISESFADTTSVSVKEWNCDKKMSDHKGIAVIF